MSVLNSVASRLVGAHVEPTSIEEELVLLLCAISEKRRAEERRLTRLIGRADPSVLESVMERHRISRLGIARLRELGADGLVGHLASAQGEERRTVMFRSHIQEALTRSICRALEERGIVAVPVKGAALARRIFGDTTLYQANDIDVLVLPERLREAVSLLQERFGYGTPRDVTDREGMPLLHYELDHSTGSPAVELHWRLHWYERRSAPEMVRRSVMNGDSLRRLAPTDELACLLLCYARDGFIGMRPLATIAGWWERYGGDLRPGALSSLGHEFPELAPALWCGSELARELVGVPVRMDLSGSRARTARRAARALAMVNWRMRGSGPQLRANAALIDLLLSPRDTMPRPLRRQVLISRKEMARRRPELAEHPVRLELARGWHVVALLARVGVGLASSELLSRSRSAGG